MKISTRISVTFSLVASIMLVIFGIAIYFLESSHQNIDFQERLKERVVITERFFLEKESFTPVEYEKIRTQFLHVLNDETEEVIELKKEGSPAFQCQYSPYLQKELLKNESFSFVEGDLQGESKRFQVNNVDYLIIVTAIDRVGKQNLTFLLSSIILLIVLGVPLIFTISFLVAKKSLLPISEKIKHANTIGASNLDQRLEISNPNDEIGEMAMAFNRLLNRLEVSFKAQKSFISNASHEMKNPLTAIMGEAEVAISKKRTPEEYEESLKNILEEVDALNLTVNNLLQLSKITALEEAIGYHVFEFDTFLIEVIESYQYLNPKNQLKLTINIHGIKIEGNKNLLKTAIINLFDNACKYSNNQKVDVNLSLKKKELELQISDIGIGIPEEEMDRIKEPFHRAKNTLQIKGTGIGLSLSCKIISTHNGQLMIHSREGEGTKVVVYIPTC